jgi:VWFA-related protein
MRNILLTVFVALGSGAALLAQSNAPESTASASTLRITSRAVLVDVVVTDRNGAPIAGLRQDAFSVSEQGKSQTISFFEEHRAATSAEPVQLPALPLNVFTNFSPMAQPPVVNVLLLDSLNTPMEDQSFVHTQALKFLKTLRPGSRMAIFTMSMGLRFVQGFTDDPAVLVAALGNKKNNEVEVPALIKSPEDANAQATVLGQMAETMPAGPGGTTTVATQAMIDAFTGFFQRTDIAQTDDRGYRTLANLQQLAAFLGGFPGRKNLIWFSESFPVSLFGMSSAEFSGTDTRTETRFEGDLKKTVNLLTAARVAVYPVDARGVRSSAFYEAGNTLPQTYTTPSQLIGVNGAHVTSTMNESMARNSDQEAMKTLARDSGGKAFVNTNGLADVIADVVLSSADFYTISYTPADRRMDDSFRPIEVKVAGGKYNLSYRRGYYATDASLPGAVQTAQKGAPENRAANDPLRPFMEFGMPQTEQILYKTLVKPLPATAETPAATDVKAAAKGPQNRYSVDFAVDLKDLNLTPDAAGLHNGTLYLSLIVYDRFGNAVSRRDHLVGLNIKPDIYTIFQQTGVQLHAEIEVPRGQYWLRTGVYDPATHRAGTMEIPLNAVKTQQVAAK